MQNQFFEIISSLFNVNNEGAQHGANDIVELTEFEITSVSGAEAITNVY